MQEAISEYKIENNPVLIYVNDAIEFDTAQSVGKEALYCAYRHWCVQRGYMPLTMIKFGKEIKRHYKGGIIDERTTNGRRIWKGIAQGAGKNSAGIS